MRRGRLSPFLFAVGLVAVLGAGVAQAQQTGAVSMTEFQFAPATLTATAGQPVNWTFRNEGQFPHDFRVQAGSQMVDAVPGDANVAPGQSATLSFTFTTPGTYDYWCPVGMHRDRGMVGRLTVLAPGAAAPAGQPKPGAPVQAPSTLPRTGDAENGAIGGLAVAGLVLLGAGVMARRRSF
jgi:LPXTG-motif cell wall-anchored protein